MSIGFQVRELPGHRLLHSPSLPAPTMNGYLLRVIPSDGLWWSFLPSSWCACTCVAFETKKRDFVLDPTFSSHYYLCDWNSKITQVRNLSFFPAALIRGNRKNCAQFSGSLDWLVSRLERLEASSGTCPSVSLEVVPFSRFTSFKTLKHTQRFSAIEMVSFW